MDKVERVIAIIPAYNEKGKVGRVVERIPKELVSEILVVDDGSEDDTAKEAESRGAKVLRHQRNKGVGAALRTGIEYALENKYDIIVVMGGDDQDDPSQVHRLLDPILNERFDFVQGSRYMAGGERQNIPLFRWVTTGIYSLIFKVITRFPISDGTNGFRAFRISIFQNKKINIWQDWLDRYELEPYLYYKAIKLNFKVTEVPVTKTYPGGKIGYTKMIPILDWWSILKPLVYLRLGLRS